MHFYKIIVESALIVSQKPEIITFLKLKTPGHDDSFFSYNPSMFHAVSCVF